MKDLRGRQIQFKNGNKVKHLPKKKVEQCFDLIELFYDKFERQFIVVKETN
jgi:hypothetical protein